MTQNYHSSITFSLCNLNYSIVKQLEKKTINAIFFSPNAPLLKNVLMGEKSWC